MEKNGFEEKTAFLRDLSVFVVWAVLVAASSAVPL